MAILWPEEHTDRARHSLRQLLHVLRKQLRGVIITTGDEYVGLDPANFWCDAVAFREAVARHADEQALAQYAGQFCDGFYVASAPGYERWQESVRDELHEAAQQAARRLAARHDSGGQLAEAVYWGRRALLLAPEDEVMLRWVLLKCEAAAGPAAALHLYREYTRSAAAELELQPSAATQALLRAISARQRQLPDPT